MSLDCYIGLFPLVTVQLRQLYANHVCTACARSLFVGRWKYVDRVRANATLRDVMRGTSISPTANPAPIRFRPSCRQSLVRPLARIYNLLPTNEVGLFSCSWLCISSTDFHTVLLKPDVALGMLTCDHAATLHCNHLIPNFSVPCITRLPVTDILLDHQPKVTVDKDP